MKQYIVIAFLFVTALHGFTQTFDAFDDMPYSNPNPMTYFQQEMKSLIRFQTNNNINVPVFASFSGRFANFVYSSNYINNLYSDILFVRDTYSKYYHQYSSNATENDNYEIEFLGGVQFRPHQSVYIPLFFSYSDVSYKSLLDNVWVYPFEGMETLPQGATGNERVPDSWSRKIQEYYFGGGAVFNFDKFKGGIYLGYAFGKNQTGKLKSEADTLVESGELDDKYYAIANVQEFRIALVPLIPTSKWKYIGYVLNYILGYLDTGDAITVYNSEDEDKGDSTANAVADAINLGFNFAFNKFHLGHLSLDAQAVYQRASYDVAAKNDMYGLKVLGQLSNFPFGFTLEGGYRHFFGYPSLLEKNYPDTGYFNASIFFPFKHLTAGLIYRYDGIYKSKITFAISTNFLSGLFTINPIEQYVDKSKLANNWSLSTDFGTRFRWNGWKVKPKETETPE
jgi:hypothetical protein